MPISKLAADPLMMFLHLLHRRHQMPARQDLADSQFALLAELLQLLHQATYRLLVLLAKLSPDRVIGLSVAFVLLIRRNPLQLRVQGRDHVVDLVVDKSRFPSTGLTAHLSTSNRAVVTEPIHRAAKKGQTSLTTGPHDQVLPLIPASPT